MIGYKKYKSQLLGLLLVAVMILPLLMANINLVRGDALTVNDFDFTIDAGNGHVAQLDTDYFEITMQKDYSGAEVWFGFNVTQNAAGKTVEFRCIQEDNLWSGTWCHPVYSEDHGVTWSECDDISIPNEVGDGRVLYFEVTPTSDNFLCYAAYPIIYSEYEEWITTIEANANCTVTSDTVSGSEELYLITVTDEDGAINRPTLWFICGQDPPETWPQHVGVGMVDFLLSTDQDANRLKEKFIWKLVPVSNPNAVRQGLTELNVNNSGGEEINVDWVNPSEPETIAMKADIQDYIDGGGNVVIILDMHAAGGAMDPQGSGIWGPNDEPNATFANIWVADVKADTIYDDNTGASSLPTNQAGGIRLRSYADSLDVSGATLELFQCQNLFDWGDAPNPVTISDLYDVGESLALALEDYADLWSSENPPPPPPPPPPTGDKPKYTEMIDSFTIVADGAWTNHNITAGEAVPKSSTVEIVMTNTDSSNPLLMGVRADYSSLNRYINRCPATAEGGMATRMLVNVSSTGLIECYAEDYDYITYYVTGYWQNVNFTELYQQIDITGDDDGIAAWTDKNLNTMYGIPVNRTISVICTNDRTDGLRECGIRTDGSVIVRELDMGRADGGGYQAYDTYVQMSSAGIVEVSSEYYGDNRIFITGYFGANINFTEAWDTKGISAGAWENIDLSGSIKNNTDVVDFTLCNAYTTDVAASHGVRTEGSDLVRVVPQSDQFDSYFGFGMSSVTDSNGVVEGYSSTISEYFKYGGYFTRWAVEEEEPSIGSIMAVIIENIGSIMGVPGVSIGGVNKVDNG